MDFRLHGWQRLWVMISTLYLLAVISFDFFIWPESTSVEKHRLNEVSKLIDKTEGKEERYDLTDIVEQSNRRGLFDNPKNEDENLIAREKWTKLADLLVARHKDSVDFAEIERRYKRDVRKISNERKQIILFSFLFWVVPVIGVYSLGSSIRWVIRGFKEKSNA